MALVHEDGTGLSNAESLASVAMADAYFTARGGTEWAALPTDAKEAALRIATDYLEAVFSLAWRSDRLTETQALSWPRVDWAGVPSPIWRACCELALKSMRAPLLPDLGPQVKAERIGPIAVTYADDARESTKHAFVMALLDPFLKTHVVHLVRV